MVKARHAADEIAFHFRQHRAHALLVLVQGQELALHRFAQLAEVRPASARRTDTSTSGPVLTSTPSSTATKTSPSDVGLVGQNPGRQRRHAIQSVRQEPKRTLAGLGDDARHAGLLGENLERQEDLKIHGRVAAWFTARAASALAGSAAAFGGVGLAPCAFASSIAPIM